MPVYYICLSGLDGCGSFTSEFDIEKIRPTVICSLGRIIRNDKKGAIPESLPPVLARLELAAENWVYLAQHFESPFKSLVGTSFSMKRACTQLSQKWVQGICQCERLFSSG